MDCGFAFIVLHLHLLSSTQHMSVSLLIFIEEVFIYLWWEVKIICCLIFYFFILVQAARLLWNINGSDRGSKSSSWGKHLWFLVKKAAGYYLHSDFHFGHWNENVHGLQNSIRECLGKINFKDFSCLNFGCKFGTVAKICKEFFL